MTQLIHRLLIGLTLSAALVVSARGAFPDTKQSSGSASRNEITSRVGETVSDLIRALNDEDMGVRWKAVVALTTHGKAAIPELVSGMTAQSKYVRQGVCLVLGRLGADAKEAVPSLIAALKDIDPRVRENAAEALGRIGPDARTAVQALVGTMGDGDPYVSGKAADALSRIGKESVPDLVNALKDMSNNVRWCAAIALGKLGPEARDAVPALVQALKDPSDNVRWSAVMALSAQHEKSIVTALRRCQYDRDEDVRWAASLVLESIEPATDQRRPSWPAIVALTDSLIPVLMDELHVPGVSLALIRDCKLTFSKSYGTADVRTRNPVTNETLFEAASMTKPVFAYSVMKLVEEKKLDLDRPLVEYLDEHSVPDQEYREHITARMVLSHTSGLPNWRKGEEERDGPLPVMFTPGSRFSYSGEGIFYLQRVVERITGEPLEVFAKRTLFDPLKLKHTSYVWTEAVQTGLASGHSADGTFLMKTRYTHANAAYTLYTTAAEYAMFLIEIMKPDRSAPHSLSQASIETMLSHQTGPHVREPIERPGRARGLGVWWGLGWSVSETADGDIVHHSGANRSGFRCFSQFSRGRGTGIVIMTNGLRGDDLWTRLISAMGDL